MSTMTPLPNLKRLRVVAALAAVLIPAPFAFAGSPLGTMAFTVSIDRPATHYVHVEFQCDAVKGEILDFKLPAWTPGYYMLMDYAKNVLGFRARDGAGRPLEWAKVSKNTWRVKAEGANTVVVGYDVYAFARSVVESSVDDGQAFLSPASLFMYVSGRIGRRVTVTLAAPPEWQRVSTGLAPVEGRPHTFVAPDFDVLYDSPILVGNQEVLSFEVRGIPHEFVGRELGSFNRPRFVADLKAMVESAATLFGELPYTHYVFMAIGPGGGGLEHLELAGHHLQRRQAERPRRVQEGHELHLPRVLPPLQRQADQTGRPRPFRLRPGELHEHALGFRGLHGLLRGPYPPAKRVLLGGGVSRTAPHGPLAPRERHRTPVHIRGRVELQRVERILRSQRASDEHRRLVLRQGLRTRGASRPRDQARRRRTKSRSTT